MIALNLYFLYRCPPTRLLGPSPSESDCRDGNFAEAAGNILREASAAAAAAAEVAASDAAVAARGAAATF